LISDDIKKLKTMFYDDDTKVYYGLFNTESIWIDDYFDDVIVLNVSSDVSLKDLYPIIDDIGTTRNIKQIAMLGYTMTVNDWLGVLNKEVKTWI